MPVSPCATAVSALSLAAAAAAPLSIVEPGGVQGRRLAQAPADNPMPVSPAELPFSMPNWDIVQRIQGACPQVFFDLVSARRTSLPLSSQIRLVDCCMCTTKQPLKPHQGYAELQDAISGIQSSCVNLLLYNQRGQWVHVYWQCEYSEHCDIG